MAKPRALRGFAALDAADRQAIAKKGGKSVPKEKRSFYANRELASEAGRKGGIGVPAEKRAFFVNRTLASAARRKCVLVRPPVGLQRLLHSARKG